MAPAVTVVLLPAVTASVLVHTPISGRELCAGGAQAVQQLLRLAPATAVLLTLDGEGHVVEEEEVPVALVQRGDLLKVLYLPP